jgi:mannose-6-phosphate isomerase
MGDPMFVEITNTPRDYVWGSKTLLPDFLGTAPDGHPQAELWLGTHPGSPARVRGRGGDLRDLVPELPFLLKVLAAAQPLSLQAHPTPVLAREGFARENAAGIPIDAPERNYKDPNAKPELIYALSDEFRALSGFRPTRVTRRVLDAARPGLLSRLRDDGDLRATLEWLLSGDPRVGEVVGLVSAVADDVDGESWRTVRRLAAAYPGDPGIAISLLLHSVVLRRGEALYLPAGNLHAYQEGLGVELMGASDNVLRGGLTPKHIDVAELLTVVDFTPIADPRVVPEVRDGVSTFAPDGAGWRLRVVEGPARLAIGAPSIVLVLSGSTNGLGRGRAAYVDAGALDVAAGVAVVADAF